MGELLNGLFELIHKEENTPDDLLYKVKSVNEHPVYKGHFPDMPVTPGVCQMMLIKKCLEQHYGASLRLSEAKECKFLSMHNPQKDNILSVTISIVSRLQGTMHVTATITSEKARYLKMRAAFCE